MASPVGQPLCRELAPNFHELGELISKSPAGIVQAGLLITRLNVLLLVIQPGIDVLLHLILRMTVAGLDLALELLAVAVDLGEIVIGELTPLLFDLAAELFPVAL